MDKITNRIIQNYSNYLINGEKSSATVLKYIRDIIIFVKWLNNRKLDKQTTIEYKKYLMYGYSPRSANSVLSPLNSLFDYLGMYDYKVKTLKIQRHIFSDKNKELTKAEYMRLLQASIQPASIQ